MSKQSWDSGRTVGRNRASTPHLCCAQSAKQEDERGSGFGKAPIRTWGQSTAVSRVRRVWPLMYSSMVSFSYMYPFSSSTGVSISPTAMPEIGHFAFGGSYPPPPPPPACVITKSASSSSPPPPPPPLLPSLVALPCATAFSNFCTAPCGSLPMSGRRNAVAVSNCSCSEKSLFSVVQT